MPRSVIFRCGMTGRARNATCRNGSSSVQPSPRAASRSGTSPARTDSNDPSQSVWGGARYLARMRDQLADVEDAEERLKMALASYNCGLGHVKDARKLAVARGLSDDTWEDVASALTLLTREEIAAQATYGYVRAAEPIQYVERIWALFHTYRHATGERDVPAATTTP